MTNQTTLQRYGFVVILSQYCLNYFLLLFSRYTFKIETKITTYSNRLQFISNVQSKFRQDMKMQGVKWFINGSNGSQCTMLIFKSMFLIGTYSNLWTINRPEYLLDPEKMSPISG
jgi:hypothetical protein